jgi:hypothetical protein
METTEAWRPVYGLKGLYEVSSYGRVRNSKHVLMTQYPTHGYLKVVLTQNSNRAVSGISELLKTHLYD